MEKELWEIFHSSVHTACVNDYNKIQLDAWAPAEMNEEAWANRMISIQPFVVFHEQKAVGYADLQPDGYIDHFYVHGDYRGKGVGRLMMGIIDERAKEFDRLYAQVSKTAMPFFKKHGFTVIKEQAVSVRGVELNNYLMERRSPPNDYYPESSTDQR